MKRCFVTFEKFQVEFRVYKTVKGMRRCKDFLGNVDRKKLIGCCNSFETKAIIYLNEEKRGVGIVAHEIFHAVHRLMMYRKRNVDFEECAEFMEALTRHFWAWWWDCKDKGYWKEDLGV